MTSVPPAEPGSGRIGFVLKGYPRLSETFIAQEILALEQRGLDILIVSLRQPTDRTVHPVHDLIRAERLYLPEYLYREPLRLWRGWRRARRCPGYRAARHAFIADLRRDRTPNRIRRFGQALVLAAELPADIVHLHAHFLHTPASVARYAAMILRLRWTVSAHAKDIWTIPEWEKREKLATADWAVSCTAAGHRHLAELSPDPERVGLCYHGVDFTRFPSSTRRLSDNDGTDPARSVIVLSVGRAVVKKGYDDLLMALARLPEGLAWRFVHVGGGPLLDDLRRQSAGLGLSARIEWRGPLAQPAVLAAYREADLFVLAAKVASDGDRDGLPNVLVEAQSQRVACIATAISGIPELIEPGVTGLLVAPGDVAGLSRAIEAAIRDPERRAGLAAAGETRVRRDFDMRHGVVLLGRRFGLRGPASPACAVRAPDAGGGEESPGFDRGQSDTRVAGGLIRAE